MGCGGVVHTGSQTGAGGRVIPGSFSLCQCTPFQPYQPLPQSCLFYCIRRCRAHTRHIYASLAAQTNVTSSDTTFRNVSFFGSLHYGDTPSGASVDWQESRYPGGRYPGSRGCWEGRDSKGVRRGTRCEGSHSGELDAGYYSLAETVMVRFEVPSTWACLLTRCCAVLGCIVHPVSRSRRYL